MSFFTGFGTRDTYFLHGLIADRSHGRYFGGDIHPPQLDKALRRKAFFFLRSRYVRGRQLQWQWQEFSSRRERGREDRYLYHPGLNEDVQVLSMTSPLVQVLTKLECAVPISPRANLRRMAGALGYKNTKKKVNTQPLMRHSQRLLGS